MSNRSSGAWPKHKKCISGKSLYPTTFVTTLTSTRQPPRITHPDHTLPLHPPIPGPPTHSQAQPTASCRPHLRHEDPMPADHSPLHPSHRVTTRCHRPSQSHLVVRPETKQQYQYMQACARAPEGLAPLCAAFCSRSRGEGHVTYVRQGKEQSRKDPFYRNQI